MQSEDINYDVAAVSLFSNTHVHVCTTAMWFAGRSYDDDIIIQAWGRSWEKFEDKFCCAEIPESSRLGPILTAERDGNESIVGNGMFQGIKKDSRAQTRASDATHSTTIAYKQSAIPTCVQYTLNHFSASQVY